MGIYHPLFWASWSNQAHLPDARDLHCQLLGRQRLPRSCDAPLYHHLDLISFFRSAFKAKPVAVFNANLPLTSRNLLETITATEPESFHSVPYTLKLPGEASGGVEALAKCPRVLFGGSSSLDNLGDLLVRNGVKLIYQYGAYV